MNLKKVAPSILAADFANLETEIKKVSSAGADWIHVDVMDGHFVPNLTIGPPVIAAIKKVSPLPLDVHLMIERPELWIEQYIEAGATSLTIHVEATDDVKIVLEKIRSRGVKAGLSLRPASSLEMIRPYLSQIDLVLVMTVEPGFGGQKFMFDQVQKIRELKKIRESSGLNFLIEVDGGINDETAPLCSDADVFVAGSYVFGNDFQTSIQTLKRVSARVS